MASEEENVKVEDESPKTASDEPETSPRAPETEATIPEVDKAAFKEQFEAFAKFGDKAADGKTIKLSQSDKWFKQAKVIDGKSMTTTDTGIAFRKVSKNSPKLSFVEWNKYLDEIAKTKKIEVNGIKDKLVNCGKPGLSGTTSVTKNAALERLTDSSRYGGTHRQRFDSAGKGKGKEGREDIPSKDGYVAGFKPQQKK